MPALLVWMGHKRETAFGYKIILSLPQVPANKHSQKNPTCCPAICCKTNRST